MVYKIVYITSLINSLKTNSLEKNDNEIGHIDKIKYKVGEDHAGGASN